MGASTTAPSLGFLPPTRTMRMMRPATSKSNGVRTSPLSPWSLPTIMATTNSRHDGVQPQHRLYATATESSEQKVHPIQEYDVINREKGLDKSYDPSTFEAGIYQWWEASGCFQPDAKCLSGGTSALSATKKDPYVLPMPPPNVTGRLHMGHAIFVALQDVLARFHRMRGRPVLWLPGTDHAGIATQLQVEKILRNEGTTREQVGREHFLKRVWEYKEEQGGHITRQLRSLGASADWSRERFTMDPDLSEAVIEAFVRLHDKGLVYRGEYMVNWAPLLQTAVSDLEVEYSEEQGKLYYFKYMVEGSDGTYRWLLFSQPPRRTCFLSSDKMFDWFAQCPCFLVRTGRKSFCPSPPHVRKLSWGTLPFVFIQRMIVTSI